ncbi:hypothetical protein CPB84DRAFT_213358 [Gymnopilus junonius]|uniref:Uncharacterized protein n=1 Tax=Gymnopilus junonius TaxID=109634 RepID=A0A9P5TRB6_GYMJU|nr:hypothetical protein CPB84DRAFT_213358 [Gymnopilus junonius]
MNWTLRIFVTRKHLQSISWRRRKGWIYWSTTLLCSCCHNFLQFNGISNLQNTRITDLGNPQLNVDGVQDNMAINYLGPLVFTQTLLPLLESTAADGADVGSDGHKDVSYLDYSSKEAWNHKFKWTMLPTLERYKYSKLAVHLWTNNLAKRLTADKSKVIVLLVHPGAILSDGAIRSLKTLPVPKFWIWLLGTMMYPQEQGGFTTVFGAGAPRDNAEISHGAYIFPPNVAKVQAPGALDEARQKLLFEVTKGILKSADVSVNGCT